MRLFDNENRMRNEHTRRVYAQFEIAYTIVDFLAAFLFIVGSILFFDAETEYAGTWMFLIGSIFFAVKPTLRMSRELKLFRMGRLEILAERARDA